MTFIILLMFWICLHYWMLFCSCEKCFLSCRLKVVAALLQFLWIQMNKQTPLFSSLMSPLASQTTARTWVLAGTRRPATLPARGPGIDRRRRAKRTRRRKPKARRRRRRRTRARRRRRRRKRRSLRRRRRRARRSASASSGEPCCHPARETRNIWIWELRHCTRYLVKRDTFKRNAPFLV